MDPTQRKIAHSRPYRPIAGRKPSVAPVQQSPSIASKHRECRWCLPAVSLPAKGSWRGRNCRESKNSRPACSSSRNPKELKRPWYNLFWQKHYRPGSAWRKSASSGFHQHPQPEASSWTARSIFSTGPHAEPKRTGLPYRQLFFQSLQNLTIMQKKYLNNVWKRV